MTPPIGNPQNEGRFKELISILKTQTDLGRTKDGWDLGQGMPEASSSSIAAMQDEGFQVKECSNCHLILSAEYFSAGCPNCGRKDRESLEVGGPEVKHE